MLITIDTVVARWIDPATRPKLWKGNLIGGSGTPDDPICRRAQGDVLHFAGLSDDELRAIDQERADAEVARLLGISVTHSILLRQVNDSADGCPEDVLRAPEKVMGPNAQALLAFWRHLDRMTEADWFKFFGDARAAWAAGDARAAGAACTEIQFPDKMREAGEDFFFLPLFGFADPKAVMSADEAFRAKVA